MSCNHCGALRRVQGGVRIGGRVELAIVPGCPCSSLERISDESETILSGKECDGAGEFTASYLQLLRFCSSFVGTVRPRILGVVCTNYDISELIISASLGTQAGELPDCLWNDFAPPGGQATWDSTGGSSSVDFENDLTPGQWVAVLLSVTLARVPDPFLDAPIIDITLEFELIL